MLDPGHNQGSQPCLCAFRSYPMESLYVETNEPSLHYRRLQFSTCIMSNPSNPVCDVISNNVVHHS